MKLSFLFLILWLPLVAATEKKIIIASFPTQQQADNALVVFESKLGSKLAKKQDDSFFSIIARPSGNSYIIAIEPIESYQEALQIKALLPQEYSDAFINNYTPPKSVVIKTKNISKQTTPPQKISTQAVDHEGESGHEASRISSETAPIQPVVSEPKTSVPAAQTKLKRSHDEPTPPQQESLKTAADTTTSTMESTLLPELPLPLEYLFIGMSLIALVLLLCLIRYYRKYRNLKKQLILREPSDGQDSMGTSSKSSDIFFVRQH